MTSRRPWIPVLLLCAPLSPAAFAQQSAGAPVELPRPQDIDPAVDTSAGGGTKGGATAGARAATGVEPVSPAAGATSVAPAKGARGKNSVPAAAAAASVPGGKPGGKALDRLELDSTQITGNRELPKVLYIVPWKRSDLGDLVGRPANSLLDEVLSPVDRDVFQRENRYYDALKPDTPRAAADAPGRGTETGATRAAPSPAAP